MKRRRKEGIAMLITLDYKSETPIYLQLRNQIILGIANGQLKNNEKLPTVRQMAIEAGVNTMTVNKTYQLLQEEGFIVLEGRKGSIVKVKDTCSKECEQKVEEKIQLLLAESKILGMKKDEFLHLCEKIYAEFGNNALEPAHI